VRYPERSCASVPMGAHGVRAVRISIWSGEGVIRRGRVGHGAFMHTRGPHRGRLPSVTIRQDAVRRFPRGVVVTGSRRVVSTAEPVCLPRRGARSGGLAAGRDGAAAVLPMSLGALIAVGCAAPHDRSARPGSTLGWKRAEADAVAELVGYQAGVHQ